VNWALAFNAQNGWRWMSHAGLPATVFFVALFFVPESPRWLVENARSPEALHILTRVNGSAARAGGTGADSRGGGAGDRLPADAATGAAARVLDRGLASDFAADHGINTVLFYGSIIFKEHVANQSNTSAVFANVVVGRELPDDPRGIGPDRQARPAAAAHDIDSPDGRVPGGAGSRISVEITAGRTGAGNCAVLRGGFCGWVWDRDSGCCWRKSFRRAFAAGHVDRHDLLWVDARC